MSGIKRIQIPMYLITLDSATDFDG